MLLDNHMSLMDPLPGNVNSIGPGKRVLSSMAPTIVLRAGRPFLAARDARWKAHFRSGGTSVIERDRSSHDAPGSRSRPRVSGPRARKLELEDGFPDVRGLRRALEELGHSVTIVEKVAGA